MSLQGTIKLFNPDKGFGFITATDGSDIFLHIKSCTDGGIPQKGDTVSFDMQESPVKPGQMQATNVTGGTGVAPAKGAGKGGGGAMQGLVKSFNIEKGFGFIIKPDGSDLFFHIKGMVDGSTPQAGDWLSYDLTESKMKPGSMQAQNISGGTGWGGDGGKGGGYGAAKGGWGFGGDGWGPYSGGKDWGKDGGKGGWGGGKDAGWGGGGKDSGWGGGGGGKDGCGGGGKDSGWGGGSGGKDGCGGGGKDSGWGGGGGGKDACGGGGMDGGWGGSKDGGKGGDWGGGGEDGGKGGDTTNQMWATMDSMWDPSGGEGGEAWAGGTGGDWGCGAGW